MSVASHRDTGRPPCGPIVLTIPAGIAALTLGVAGGLSRLGITPSTHLQPALIWHGALIVFGFLGLLVGLERAVVVRLPWAYSSPLLTAIGSVLMLMHAPSELVAATWCVSALIALLAVMRIDQRHPSHANQIMKASCLMWMLGAAAWGAGATIAMLLPMWSAFIVLMIVGERMQFGKLARTPWVRRSVLTGRVGLIIGALIALHTPHVGAAICGATFTLLGVTLLMADVRPRAKMPGIMRYVSVGLASAYIWLVCTGVLWMLASMSPEILTGDAAIHTLFLGFVIGMIFTHAPMIFPALTGIRMPYRRTYYIHVALLQAGLMLRVGGDLSTSAASIRTGAIMSSFALGVFFMNLVVSAVAARVGASQPRSTAAFY